MIQALIEDLETFSIFCDISRVFVNFNTFFLKLDEKFRHFFLSHPAGQIIVPSIWGSEVVKVPSF